MGENIQMTLWTTISIIISLLAMLISLFTIRQSCKVRENLPELTEAEIKASELDLQKTLKQLDEIWELLNKDTKEQK